jgi:hypothetical protein
MRRGTIEVMVGESRRTRGYFFLRKPNFIIKNINTIAINIESRWYLPCITSLLLFDRAPQQPSRSISIIYQTNIEPMTTPNNPITARQRLTK